MRKILLAYLFLLADLEFVVNAQYCGMLLPLVSGGLLVVGFAELANENERFEHCIRLVVGMLVLRGALQAVRHFGTFSVGEAYRVLIALAIVGAFFVLTHYMISVFQEIEEENDLFAATRFCKIGETCLVAIALGAIYASAIPTIALNFTVLSVIAGVVFLVALYQVQVVYLRFEKIA